MVNDENVRNTRKFLEVFLTVDGDGSKYWIPLLELTMKKENF